MTDALTQQFPGVDFNFSQYIQDNVEEAASGVKGENSVKIYGNDLETLETTADQIAEVLAEVPGITDLAVLRSLGQPTIRIDVDRARAARYGLAPGDVNAVVQAAIGGQTAGDLYEAGSDRHFPMMVRLAPPYPAEPRLHPAHSDRGAGSDRRRHGARCRWRMWPTSSWCPGASFIYREQQERYVPIKFSVRGRDLGSAVLEAQARVDAARHAAGRLSAGVGRASSAICRKRCSDWRSSCRCAIALICCCCSSISALLSDVLLAASVIPMALVGGIFALCLTGTPFSVSAAIGFVALFGIAAMDGIMVLSYYNLSLEYGARPRQRHRCTPAARSCGR